MEYLSKPVRDTGWPGTPIPTAPAQVRDALIGLAQGADVLVHEVMWPTAIDRLLAKAYNAAALKKSIPSHHTAAEDAGRVAAQAGVKTLVLSHFVPSEDPELPDEKWVEAVRRGGYKGPIVAGKDLLEI